jgi:hypothetical protein
VPLSSLNQALVQAPQATQAATAQLAQQPAAVSLPTGQAGQGQMIMVSDEVQLIISATFVIACLLVM